MNKIVVLSSELEPEIISTPAEPAPRRVPHLGHALLFIGMAVPFFLLSVGAFMVIFHATTHAKAEALLMQLKFSLAAQGITYLLTIALAWAIFSLLWERPFPEGLSWNFPAALRLSWRIPAIGLFLGWVGAAVESRLPQPKDMPIEKLFQNAHASNLWLLTIFGTLLAPLFEEICFRGFLLPGFAIAWEWITCKRDNPEHVTRWNTTDSIHSTSWTVGSVVASLFFILLHAPQLAGSWSALSLLFCVSLLFCYLRLRYRSVAVTFLVHASYNFSVFLGLMIATGGYRHLDKLHP